MSLVPSCRNVKIHTFRSDRTAAFRQRLFKALDDEKTGRGSGPPYLDCLLFAGHTGVSIGGRTIYGFNPDAAGLPIWQVMQQLRGGGAYPGIIRIDSQVFSAAQQRGLTVLTFDIAFAPNSFTKFQAMLNRERKRSHFSYGFPDSDGDCNCTTWLERLGLPLLTGRMDEFASVLGVAAQLPRRFGLCV